MKPAGCGDPGAQQLGAGFPLTFRTSLPALSVSAEVQSGAVRAHHCCPACGTGTRWNKEARLFTPFWYRSRRDRTPWPVIHLEHSLLL